MTLSKTYQTILANLALAVISIVLIRFFDWLFFAPIIFSLGVPLVNINKPLKQKLGLTAVIVAVSTAIFALTVWVVVRIYFDFDKYLFPGILMGVSGIALLSINGLLIENVKLNFKTITLTFLLSGSSLPVWTLLLENVPTFNTENMLLFGSMLFWMVLTTVAMSYSIQKESI